APGAFVVGAMADGSDPRERGSSGMFADPGACAAAGLSEACLVTDDFHGVSAGTSMAAPLVTGAIALLFAQHPELDQLELRNLLQAGARPLEGAVFDEQQVGAGGLDLERTLDALGEQAGTRLPGAATALVLSGSFVHPDPEWPLDGLVQVRDDAGRIADGFDAARLSIQVQGGALVHAPERSAPGLYRFQVTADYGSGGRDLSIGVRFDGEVLVEKSLPIAVDPALAQALPSARGGCSVAAPAGRNSWPAWPILLALFAARRRLSRLRH
ncbi:MAG TPA: S8 family serine peptidase, partial [Polyangiaceae bacterium]